MRLGLIDLIKRFRTPRAIQRLLAHATPEERKELGRSGAFAGRKELIERAAREQHVRMKAGELAVARDLVATEFKAANGLGELQLRVPLETFHAMKGKYGENCWSDPEFIEAFKRDNPHLVPRIRRGTRGQEYAGRSLGQRRTGGLIICPR